MRVIIVVTIGVCASVRARERTETSACVGRRIYDRWNARGGGV